MKFSQAKTLLVAVRRLSDYHRLQATRMQKFSYCHIGVTCAMWQSEIFAWAWTVGK